MKKNLIVSIIALVFLSLLTTTACAPQDRYQAENIIEGNILQIYTSTERPNVVHIGFSETGTLQELILRDQNGDLHSFDMYNHPLTDPDDPDSATTVSAIYYDERGRVTTGKAIRAAQHVQIGYDVRISNFYGRIIEKEVVRFVRILKSEFTLLELYMQFAKDFEPQKITYVSVNEADLLTESQKQELVRLSEEFAGKTLPLVTYREVDGKKGYYDENDQRINSGLMLKFNSFVQEDGTHFLEISLNGHYKQIELIKEKYEKWSVYDVKLFIS